MKPSAHDIQVCSNPGGRGGVGGGVLKLRPEVQTPTLVYTTFTGKIPLSYTYIFSLAGLFEVNKFKRPFQLNT